MKSHVLETLGLVFIFAFAFGMLQPSTAQAVDKRQALQDLSAVFAEIAHEVGKTVVAIEAERAEDEEDRRERFRFRGEPPWEKMPREFRRRFRRNSDHDEERNYEFFFRLPERQGREFRNLPERLFRRDFPDRADFGSGILIDNKGHIATTTELVNDSDEVYVTLQDGSRLEAKVIGSDEATGIAVIKVNSDALPIAKFGDSDQVAVGELVLGVRHTADADASVSFGVISGLGRNPHVVDYENWIEIDANLRPGSGGGAVVSASGEVIGMSVANPPGGGFAIPINTVRHITMELIEDGKVGRGWLGVMVQGVDSAMAEELKLEKPMGALITHVGDGTPAAEAGLQKGDVIIAVEGNAIENPTHLRHVIGMVKPDSTVAVTLMREGEKLDIPVTLVERTGEGVHRSFGQSPPSDKKGQTGWKGLSLQNLTEELAEAFGYELDEGLLIAGVEPDSPAAGAGEGDEKLRRGDLILEVENQPVHSVEAFKTAVPRDKESILLRGKRDEQVWYVMVK
jgi:serine protease Do